MRELLCLQVIAHPKLLLNYFESIDHLLNLPLINSGVSVVEFVYYIKHGIQVFIIHPPLQILII